MLLSSNHNTVKPELPSPFPMRSAVWTDPKSGYKIPRGELRNIKWRQKLLKQAECDPGIQRALWAACEKSVIFWINTFVWTYHQFDVDEHGSRIAAKHEHVPFVTWDIQNELFDELARRLDSPDLDDKGRDILINKSRDMGASWSCLAFMHWLWLFRPNSQLLELSRTEDYVDKSGNMKALFQKHDYINKWLPDWMLPPDCLPGGKNRTKMHLMNGWNGSCIDGESTTEHAASGDRRLVILLDEFAKVKNGKLMRSATRDAGLMRLVNSTVAGPGTEYSRWKNSGQIYVFPLMWWDHPEKGRGRYAEQDPLTAAWKIRSPWYAAEEKVRSRAEMAREIDAEDVEAGDLFFAIENVEKHMALFSRDPLSRWEIDLKHTVTNESIKDKIRIRDPECYFMKKCNGPLRVWVKLLDKRLDQTKTYIIGIDLSKGQGASNTVFSIKCKETKTKVAEWRDANTPPYEAARVAVALALWVGGRGGLPVLKWENNGPGWDFGRQIVQKYFYPKYYMKRRIGQKNEQKTRSYGWHSGQREKEELLREYDRALAHGGYINPCKFALEEARQYIYYPSGGIGPAALVEEDEKAKKTHGDCVIADALTLDDRDTVGGPTEDIKYNRRTAAYRKQQLKNKRRGKSRQVTL